MLTVHHLEASQSDRIVWLCEELAIPYELKRYDRDADTRMAPAAYKKLHSFGTAPVITDGDLVLSESGAIIEYIIQKYGHGRLSVSPDSPEYADYLHWFHFANGSFMPAWMIEMFINLMGGSDHAIAKAFGERLAKSFAMAEDRLGQGSYFAGETFTAADIIMLFPLTTMRMFAPMDMGPFPHIRAYLQRISERPAYQRAVNKAAEH